MEETRDKMEAAASWEHAPGARVFRREGGRGVMPRRHSGDETRTCVSLGWVTARAAGGSGSVPGLMPWIQPWASFFVYLSYFPIWPLPFQTVLPGKRSSLALCRVILSVAWCTVHDSFPNHHPGSFLSLMLINCFPTIPGWKSDLYFCVYAW